MSVSALEAPQVVSSAELDESLAPAYARHGVKAGQIERLAGVVQRRWYPPEADYTDGAVDVGRAAMADAGVEAGEIGLVINASVTRPYLEPGISARVHHELGLPRRAIAFDLTNACLGVANAMHVAGTMIDAGQIDNALIVASEGSRQMQESSIKYLLSDDSTREDVKEAFATMTLGSGAVGLVLGRSDARPDGHRVIGGVTRAGSEHHTLCVGGMDGMRTDSSRLFREGLTLATEAWKDARGDFDWDDMDWYVAHQTSTIHIEALCKTLGLPQERFPMTLPTYGNIGPVAMPYTLAFHQDNIERGQRVLLMGIGSGLNTSMTEVAW
nr:3-oxoacyl-ACP synthase III [Kineosphaera limosa]